MDCVSMIVEFHILYYVFSIFGPRCFVLFVILAPYYRSLYARLSPSAVLERDAGEVDCGTRNHSRSGRGESIFALHYNCTIVIHADREVELRDGIRTAPVDARSLSIYQHSRDNHTIHRYETDLRCSRPIHPSCGRVDATGRSGGATRYLDARDRRRYGLGLDLPGRRGALRRHGRNRRARAVRR